MMAKEEHDRRKAASDSSAEKNRSDRWSNKLKEPMTAFTGALAICTAFLVAIGAMQYYTLKKSDETNRVGLRPYIFGTGMTVDTDRYPFNWDISVTLENSGGTPPSELQYFVRSSPEFPIDPEEIFRSPSETDYFFNRSVAPKGKIDVRGGMPMSRFFTDKNTWYVHGAIHYRDQFEGSKEHISKFCFSLVSVRDYKSNTTRPAYDACPFWNCVGEKACANDRARYDAWTKANHINASRRPSDTPEVPIGTGLPTPYGMIIKAK